MNLINIQKTVIGLMLDAPKRKPHLRCLLHYYMDPNVFIACTRVHLSLKPGITSTKSSGWSQRTISRSIADVVTPRPIITAGENS